MAEYIFGDTLHYAIAHSYLAKILVNINLMIPTTIAKSTNFLYVRSDLIRWNRLVLMSIAEKMLQCFFYSNSYNNIFTDRCTFCKWQKCRKHTLAYFWKTSDSHLISQHCIRVICELNSITSVSKIVYS